MLEYRPYEVAIVMRLATRWGRDVLQGIVDYTRQGEPWYFSVDAVNDPGSASIPNPWHGDGIIGRFSARDVPRLQHLDCPIVSVAHNVSDQWPHVVTNYERGAELVAEHLIDAGLKNFAHITPGALEEKLAPFRGRVEQAGGRCWAFSMQPPEGAEFADFGPIQQRLADWIRHLPKPVGIFVANDLLGRLVLHICVSCGMDVPNEVAVVGTGNDELLCEMAFPPLSSLSLATRRQGYEAAALLDRMMRGEPPPSEPIRIDPIEVLIRRSSDVVAVEDPDVAKAVRFIRQNAAHKPISVDDLLKIVPVRRRSLESRFRHWLGRSPAAEIRRVRFERARHLLANTDMPLDTVAQASGFVDQAHLCRVFQRRLATTPRRYRLSTFVGTSRQ